MQQVVYLRKTTSMQYDTYIEQAWAAHAEKLTELNRLLMERAALDVQLNRVQEELAQLATAAADALPWGPEVEID